MFMEIIHSNATHTGQWLKSPCCCRWAWNARHPQARFHGWQRSETNPLNAMISYDATSWMFIPRKQRNSEPIFTLIVGWEFVRYFFLDSDSRVAMSHTQKNPSAPCWAATIQHESTQERAVLTPDSSLPWMKLMAVMKLVCPQYTPSTFCNRPCYSNCSTEICNALPNEVRVEQFDGISVISNGNNCTWKTLISLTWWPLSGSNYRHRTWVKVWRQCTWFWHHWHMSDKDSLLPDKHIDSIIQTLPTACSASLEMSMSKIVSYEQ